MARSKTRTGKPSPDHPEATPVAPGETALAPVALSGENGKSQSKKAASRSSVVPFSLEEEIRRRAFELYTQRGAHPEARRMTGWSRSAKSWIVTRSIGRRRSFRLDSVLAAKLLAPP